MRMRIVLTSFAAISGLIGCGGSTQQQPATTPPPVLLGVAEGTLGGQCVVNDDCNSGFCDRTVPGGQCTAQCGSDADCPADGACFEGWCLRRCSSQRECRDGAFDCFAEPGADEGICGLQVDAVAPAAPNIGAPCTASIECAAPDGVEPYCLPEIGYNGAETGFVGGICSAVGCTADADCGTGRCVGAENARFCLPGCASDTDCRDGYACHDAACVPAARTPSAP